MIALAGLGAIGASAAAADTTIRLTTPQDEVAPGDGLCSLREAVLFANGTPEGDCSGAVVSGVTTIIAPRGCYRLVAMGQLVVNLGVEIVLQGAGADAAGCFGSGTVIDAQHTSRVLLVQNAANVSISGVTVTGGVAVSDGGGIEIGQNSGLTLMNAAVTGNAAGAGADGSSSGAMGGFGGRGGAIFSDKGGIVKIVDSTISGNAAGNGGLGGDGNAGASGGAGGDGGAGGGIYMAQFGTVSVAGSSITGNRAGAGGDGGISSGAGGAGGNGGDGGGIARLSPTGSLTVTNSTIAGNAAGDAGGGANGSPHGVDGVAGGGGGIFDQGGTSLTNVTVAGNSAHGIGDGLEEELVSPSIATDSVIAGNGTRNCTGPAIQDGGFNLTFPAQPFSDCPGTTADPKLGPLQHNGGPTETMALPAGSAAIGLGPATGCSAADQRGVARPQGSRCDAGAFEWAPPVLGTANAAATGQTSAVANATVSNPDLQDARVAVSYGTSTAYGATTAPTDLGVGGAPGGTSIAVTGLTPGTAYHLQLLATNADGTSASGDLTITTSSPPSSRAPTVSGFRQSASRWIGGSAFARACARRRRTAVGTTFSFALSENARYVLTFSRTITGRRSKGGCVALTKRNRRNRACTRIFAAGSLAFDGHAGSNRVSFQGRLTRAKRLALGHYSVSIIATDALRQRSKPQQLMFLIVRR